MGLSEGEGMLRMRRGQGKVCRSSVYPSSLGPPTLLNSLLLSEATMILGRRRVDRKQWDS